MFDTGSAGRDCDFWLTLAEQPQLESKASYKYDSDMPRGGCTCANVLQHAITDGRPTADQQTFLLLLRFSHTQWHLDDNFSLAAGTLYSASLGLGTTLLIFQCYLNNTIPNYINNTNKKENANNQ